MRIALESNHSLVVGIDSAHLRLCMRAYFTILFFLLPFIGDQICRLRARRLLDKEGAPLVVMTGWPSISLVAEWLVKLRQLPGGWIGALVVLTAGLSFASDFAVSGLVKTVDFPSRCQFNEGVVIPPQSQVTWRSIVNPQQLAYRMASQAQTTSLRNGGRRGIFPKINADLRFRADETDYLGGWSCSVDGKPQDFPANTTAGTVQTALKGGGRLFTQSSHHNNSYPDGTISDLLFMSASVADTVAERWDIRIALEPTTRGKYQPFSLVPYFCQMDAPHVEWVMKQIEVQSTISAWVVSLYGELDDRQSSDVTSSAIEQSLNSLIMVGCGGYSYTKVSVNATQGCLVGQTTVPLSVVVLLSLATALFFFMVGVWCCLGVAPHKFAFMPHGLTEWMGRAIWEHMEKGERPEDGEIPPTEFNSWKFEKRRGGIELVRTTTNLYVLGNQTPAEYREDKGLLPQRILENDRSIREPSPPYDSEN